jgi:hypothetical protein
MPIARKIKSHFYNKKQPFTCNCISSAATSNQAAAICGSNDDQSGGVLEPPKSSPCAFRQSARTDQTRKVKDS